MLEGVGVQVAGVQRGIGRLVVIELDQLDLQSVAGRDLLDHVEDLLGRADGNADADGGLLLRLRAGGEGGGQDGDGQQADQGGHRFDSGWDRRRDDSVIAVARRKIPVGMTLCALCGRACAAWTATHFGKYALIARSSKRSRRLAAPVICHACAARSGVGGPARAPACTSGRPRGAEQLLAQRAVGVGGLVRNRAIAARESPGR